MLGVIHIHTISRSHRFIGLGSLSRPAKAWAAGCLSRIDHYRAAASLNTWADFVVMLRVVGQNFEACLWLGFCSLKSIWCWIWSQSWANICGGNLVLKQPEQAEESNCLNFLCSQCVFVWTKLKSNHFRPIPVPPCHLDSILSILLVMGNSS